MNRPQLVGPNEAKFIGLNVLRPLWFVSPPDLRLVRRPLCEDDVIISDDFVDEALWIGFDLLISSDRGRRGKGSNDVRVAALQVPKIMQVTVGKNGSSGLSVGDF